MDIKILGTGCARCQRLEQLTRDAAAAQGVSIEVEHVREPAEIMKYPVVGTPALVVNGEVKAAGRIPSPSELAGWLRPQ
ncbi:thioredoxin family protein [Limnohabitans sp. 2KL-1]|jgi:small redox-active disulfide protein 2|uniref:thioredoxin family protein n=1 Tax=Limnohabitans sp. 2KL-1 TaxID=1100699 RepID=UPI000D335FEC|nr:thioredoxin family protein [Limnohabitans sp. 2KL-1]PUE50429.1 thioredoxin family protein [Limnohabitans sp. 2KL-1]